MAHADMPPFNPDGCIFALPPSPATLPGGADDVPTCPGSSGGDPGSDWEACWIDLGGEG